MSASLAGAQGTDGAARRPLDFGLLGGLSMPMGDFGDGAKVGFHIGGFGAARLSETSPLKIRAELVYNRFGLEAFDDDDVPNVDVDGNASVLSITGNAVYDLPAEGMVRPYVMGGLGLYRSTVSIDIDTPVGGGDDSDSETDLGFNLGGGLNFQLSGFATFLEIRYHTAGDVSYIPISFGIRF